jgi:hypothetical protein
MNPQRLRILVTLVLILGGIRFLLIPWLEHQASAIESLSVVTKRFDRATGLIENRKAITESLAKLERSTLEVRQRFPQALDLQSFRLSAQEGLTALVAQRGFGVKLFEWAADGKLERAGLHYSRARIQFEGGFRDLTNLQADLETRFPNMLVREMSVASPVSIRGPDDVVVSMNLVVDFYFRPAPPSGTPPVGAT